MALDAKLIKDVKALSSEDQFELIKKIVKMQRKAIRDDSVAMMTALKTEAIVGRIVNKGKPDEGTITAVSGDRIEVKLDRDATKTLKWPLIRIRTINDGDVEKVKRDPMRMMGMGNIGRLVMALGLQNDKTDE